MLEKSRVSAAPKTERNYHIFYTMLVGFDDNLKKKYKLDKIALKNYKFLKKTGVFTSIGWPDAEEYKNVIDAYTTMEFTDEE